eukprot:gnl/TRDRNA2_/TRDRNA2_168588_c0_seq1.p1 gnl/TRDRNA2_/TRDRNA2_168588_c0~~gnl/TRDRNA2_/TRDRNA2_168588_c0_seq1.p1  ORF type:complete len:248 (+),score=45.59 gnl/TRDRNA2_/TRDRNA2_168588_c0_seq1:86-745(+)
MANVAVSTECSQSRDRTGTNLEIENSIEQIFDLFRQQGDQGYIGEAITQQQHGEQAAKCATDAGFDDDTILGALFHDIGHLIGLTSPDNYPQMDSLGTHRHEHLGADLLLSLGFSKKTADLVRRHVDAKRYLTWKNPAYYDKLSEASKGTLKHQGGPMSEEEALAFERDELHRTIIMMRTWDEKAKVVNPPFHVPSLESYRPMMRTALKRGRASHNLEK